MSATPRYAWRDAAGTVTSLMNPERFVVLRDGIRGFADTTDDRTLTATADRLAQRCTGTTAQPRELGFTVMIIGSSHTDLLANRQHLIDMFAEPGTLSINLGDRTVSIACYAARGSPDHGGKSATNSVQLPDHGTDTRTRYKMAVETDGEKCRVISSRHPVKSILTGKINYYSCRL